jgi:hypothetical protein
MFLNYEMAQYKNPFCLIISKLVTLTAEKV